MGSSFFFRWDRRGFLKVRGVVLLGVSGGGLGRCSFDFRNFRLRGDGVFGVCVFGFIGDVRGVLRY